MDDTVAMHQIRLTRGRGTENCIRDVESNINWRVALQAEAERKFVQWLFLMKPSKEMVRVTEWVRMFQGRCGQMTRFPLLALSGDSRMGKTRYAVNLFGSTRTLVVPCQGVAAPVSAVPKGNARARRVPPPGGGMNWCAARHPRLW